MSVLFVEYNKRNSDHRAINRALVKAFNNPLSENLVACYEEYYDSVFFDLDLDPVFVENQGESKGFYHAMVQELSLILKLLFMHNLKPEKVVILSSSPLGRLLLSLAFAIGFLRDADKFFVMHSEYGILFSRCKSLKKRIFRYILKASLLISRDKVTHVILGRHIALDSHYLGKSVLVLDHPVEALECDLAGEISRRTNDHRQSLVISFIGMASENKGFGKFLTLRDMFSGKSQFSFQVVGRVVDTYDVNLDGFDFFSYNYVSHSKMTELLAKTDVAIFFYGSEYDYIASGAVIDCIKFSIPIIALDSTLFKDFSYRYNFVKVFQTLEEIVSFINSGMAFREFLGTCDFSPVQYDFSISQAVARVESFREI